MVFTAQELKAAAAILTFADLLANADIPLAFGGLVFNLIPELRTRIPGHFLGETLDEAPDAAEQLLGRQPKQVEVAPPSKRYLNAQQAFTEKHAALIAELSYELGQEGIPTKNLTDANLHLTEDVIAALQLGDLHFLARNIDWVKGLIVNYGIPSESLDRYVEKYRAAVVKVMGDDGEVVSKYFEELSAIAG